jgi:nucleotide-binding universal stress UspA family protein
MRILCGIDGCEPSARAAGVAAELAKRLDALLTLYMVNPAIPGRGARLHLWSDEHVGSTLNEMVRRGRWSGVPNVNSASRRATNVADAIVDYADEHDVDYIVIGASRRPEVLKMLSGSISREVLAKANCPVVIVGRMRGQQPRQTRGGRPEPIVFHDTVHAVA